MGKQGFAGWSGRALALTLSATLVLGAGATYALSEGVFGEGAEASIELQADGQDQAATELGQVAASDDVEAKQDEGLSADAATDAAPAGELEVVDGQGETLVPSNNELVSATVVKKTGDNPTTQVKGEDNATPASDPITFINEKGEEDTTPSATCKDLSGSKTGWLPLESGWYCFTKSVTLDGRAQVKGDVKIILCDGVKVTWNGGINVGEGKSLTIYAQSTGDGAGELVADRSQGKYEAGIGGNNNQNAGKITICGGTIKALGGDEGAGIGGGNGFRERTSHLGGGGGTITIYDGTVRATGKERGAGIGGGFMGTGGDITVYGGDVKGSGGTTAGIENNGGAGIGSGSNKWYESKSSMEEDAESNLYGTGEDCFGGHIQLLGGTVRGVGGYGAAAIGGGKYCSSGKIEIDNCTVIANGGTLGAGIGSGVFGHRCLVYITDSTVTADGWGGAGIGTGWRGGGTCRVYIHGGRVKASAHSESNQDTRWTSDCGAGIGSGFERNAEKVVIEDGAYVEAHSEKAAAIGHGENGKDHGSIELYDEAKVTSEKTADTNLRTEFCKYRNDVVIEPCEHAQQTAKLEGDHHVRHCQFCKYELSEDHAIDEHGTCWKCGTKDLHPVFAKTDLVIVDQLALKFWLKVSDVCKIDRDAASVTLSVGGRQHREVTLALADAETADNGLLGFTMPLSPLELAEPVTATLNWDGDDAVTKTCSAVECAQGSDEAFRTSAEAVVAYGRSMQRYLSAANGWEIGKDYAEITNSWGGAASVSSVANALAPYESKRSDETADAGRVTMSVAFGSKTRVDVYVTPKAGKVAFSGMACWAGEFVKAENLGNGSYRFSIEDIAAADLDKTIELVGVCGDKPFNVKTSVLAYANLQMQKSDDDATKAAMAELYRYFLAAQMAVGAKA